MVTNISAEQLAQQIERLVEDFVAGGRAAATAALDRAFASAKSRGRPAATAPKREQVGPRRPPQEMEALRERLYEMYEAICAKPGESTSVLAPTVGATPRALQVPAKHLKAAGRIRSVGQRQSARYFPMVKSSSKSS